MFYLLGDSCFIEYSFKFVYFKELEMVFWTSISALLLLILLTLLFTLWYDIAKTLKMKLFFLEGLLVINTVLFNEAGKGVYSQTT